MLAVQKQRPGRRPRELSGRPAADNQNMQQVALFVGDAAVLRGGVLGMSRGIQGRVPGNRGVPLED